MLLKVLPANSHCLNEVTALAHVTGLLSRTLQNQMTDFSDHEPRVRGTAAERWVFGQRTSLSCARPVADG